MDVRYFLGLRTAFIRHYFDEAGAPFRETIRKIDAKDAPFEEPEWDPETMSDEPPFLNEWLQAQTGLEVIGQTCVSMLSESLKVYLRTLERNAGLDCETECGPKVFKKGFISGYRICFEKLGVDWTNCPVDFDVLEQVVLARNASQHVNQITHTRASHTPGAIGKYPSPLFISDHEKTLMENGDGNLLIDPTIHVTRSDLHLAIEEIEKLAAWLEP